MSRLTESYRSSQSDRINKKKKLKIQNLYKNKKNKTQRSVRVSECVGLGLGQGGVALEKKWRARR